MVEYGSSAPATISMSKWTILDKKRKGAHRFFGYPLRGYFICPDATT